jgi:hypothetical protein
LSSVERARRDGRAARQFQVGLPKFGHAAAQLLLIVLTETRPATELNP